MSQIKNWSLKNFGWFIAILVILNLVLALGSLILGTFIESSNEIWFQNMTMIILAALIVKVWLKKKK